ncbi:hypothetical protein H257_03380 [Aphanomyces astaci]|uniref:Uncharacterized protein n=1 Tax=Aphanomyces astaci TaxID=112090 RepID=W4GXF6_APHAT|nr:hypothetical protein H257_03380 [Aphanomyces astaci]ETV84021.1 hypothetical protein H257_03380 [Aphanomyces astaci]|eukprot:XP_009825713.1 hypothetical protein H257_03380 [Aphanomyces astaci]
MDPHSVAYIRHTFCTRGTITSKKPGNVGPKQLIPLNSSKSSFMRAQGDVLGLRRASTLR